MSLKKALITIVLASTITFGCTPQKKDNYYTPRYLIYQQEESQFWKNLDEKIKMEFELFDNYLKNPFSGENSIIREKKYLKNSFSK